MEASTVAVGKGSEAMEGAENCKLQVQKLVAVAVAAESKKKTNHIRVSNTKKPFVFYLNLAKRYIKQYNDVELSALGMAIPTVVTISEILKRNGLAIVKKVLTSSVGLKEDDKGRPIQKAKIEILLEKAEKLEETTVAAPLIMSILKKVLTSSVGLKEDDKGPPIQKAKIEILLEKAEKLDETTVAAPPEKAAEK